MAHPRNHRCVVSVQRIRRLQQFKSQVLVNTQLNVVLQLLVACAATSQHHRIYKKIVRLQE